MWIAIVEGVIIAILLISISYLYTYYKNLPDPIPSPTPSCPSCPTLTSVISQIKSDGSTVATITPVNLPPLLAGISNGQYISDIGTGAIYYVQNNALSYIGSISVLTKMSSYKGNAAGHPSASIAKMAFGPPILS